MHTVSATRTIDMPVATVWNAFDDFGNVYRRNPMVEHSESINDRATGEGAQRQCDFYDGGTIREEVVERVPEQRLAWNIFDLGPFPLKEGGGRMDLEPIDENSTEVTLWIQHGPYNRPPFEGVNEVENPDSGSKRGEHVDSVTQDRMNSVTARVDYLFSERVRTTTAPRL